MKVFLIKKDQETKPTIMRVQEGEISSFREEYDGKIILEADSIQELLISFGELLKSDEIEIE